MQEYLSDAIVLQREANGDMDIRVSLFTKRYGKLRAKVKSARKITSKLGPHLSVGNVISARLVEVNGLQLVDALKLGNVSIGATDLAFLSGLLADADEDKSLWAELIEQRFSWKEVLAVLGWDPAHASCASCTERAPEFFHAPTQMLVCGPCHMKFDRTASRASVRI